MELYNSKDGFENIQKLVENLEFESLVNQTAAEYLKELGINERFSNEILQTATRGNYCQNLNGLHALAVMVSMEAGHGTWAVEEGNFRIFEEFASRSSAALQLGTKVVSVNNITEVDHLGNEVNRYVIETQDGINQVFDDVVLATPLEFSGIQFPFPTKQHQRDYHIVHVTLVAGHADPSYFKKTLDTLPSFVVTTGPPLGKLFIRWQVQKTNDWNIDDGFKDGIPLFQTFSVHRILENGESVIKIFSAHKLEENELDQLFLNRSWTYNKEWHAFPELDPVVKENEFPPFILKVNEQDEHGIIYTSAFENFISVSNSKYISITLY